jgi:hypothetical protein
MVKLNGMFGRIVIANVNHGNGKVYVTYETTA